MTIFGNLREVFPHAYAEAPCGIAYHPGVGWSCYNLKKGVPENSEPDFIVLARGKLPLPLNDHATLAMVSMILDEPAK